MRLLVGALVLDVQPDASRSGPGEYRRLARRCRTLCATPTKVVAATFNIVIRSYCRHTFQRAPFERFPVRLGGGNCDC